MGAPIESRKEHLTMTTQHATDTIGETDVLTLLTKLKAWAQDLSAADRTCLEAVLVRAATVKEADVAGFLMKSQPYEPALRPVPSPESGAGGAVLTPTFGGLLGGALPRLLAEMTAEQPTTPRAFGGL
jgi:hypothetical protein